MEIPGNYILLSQLKSINFVKLRMVDISVKTEVKQFTNQSNILEPFRKHKLKLGLDGKPIDADLDLDVKGPSLDLLAKPRLSSATLLDQPDDGETSVVCALYIESFKFNNKTCNSFKFVYDTIS